jgi:hypothetical protein
MRGGRHTTAIHQAYCQQDKSTVRKATLVFRQRSPDTRFLQHGPAIATTALVRAVKSAFTAVTCDGKGELCNSEPYGPLGRSDQDERA